MAIRKIMLYDTDDILRKKSIAVANIDEGIRKLLEDMADTMYSTYAFGLAAVQVGVLKRVVVLRGGNGLISLINPVIIKEFGQQTVMEGCLSLPGIRGSVKRPYTVLVKALNIRGETIITEYKGYLARAVCHEIDHLDGVLFVDKVIPGTIVGF